MKRKTKRLLAIVAMVLLLSLCIGMQVFAADDEPIRGDYNEDGKVDIADAIYLLRHTMMPSRYPISQSGDVNGTSSVDIADAIYLLRHTMMPTRYPILTAHELTHVEAKDATCTEDGNIEYWYCEECDKYYSDKNASNEISLDEIILAKCHKYGEWYVFEEASCIDEGLEHRDCSGCNEFETKVIEKIEHNYSQGVCRVCGKEKAYAREENTIYFGEYPQSLVEDNTVITTLNSAAGTLPTEDNSQAWTSYGYYVSGSISNYMWYIDVEDGGERYRGVYFTSYRPYYTTSSSSASTTYQDDNGYSISTVYWFKYEPISWSILSEDYGLTALIICDIAIDSQEYYMSTAERAENGTTIYANNYEYSTIRTWLNEIFYDTAFSALQQDLIIATTVINNASSTMNSSNEYACENTEDKIFILSYQELTSYLTSSDLRYKKASDYAQIQGSYVFDDDGNVMWWLRSPDSDSSTKSLVVGADSNITYFSVRDTSSCVVPILQIRLCEGHMLNGFNMSSSKPYNVNTLGVREYAGKEATCRTNGLGYYTCETCGYIQSVITYKNHTLNGVEIDEKAPVNSNTVGLTTFKNTQPTCTVLGTGSFSCDVCENFLVVEVYAEHNLKVSRMLEQTCTTAGYIDYVCSKCSYYVSEPLQPQHSFSYEEAENGDLYKTCSSCKYSYLVAYAYDFVNIEEATCIKAGKLTYISVSGEEIEISIPKTHHILNGVEMSEALYLHSIRGITEFANTSATCSKNGAGYFYCEFCYKMVSINTYKEHTYTLVTSNVTCTENGLNTYTCSVCGNIHNEEVEKLNHNYNEILIEPTCTKYGYKEYTCTRCEESYKEDLKDPLWHDYSNGTCTRCGSKDEGCEHADIDASVLAPTCNAGGYTTYACKDCEFEYRSDYIDALGHIYSDWYVEVDATCFDNGIERRDCQNCDVFETKNIEKLNHSSEKGVCPICQKPYNSCFEFTLSGDNSYYIISRTQYSTESDIIIPNTYNGLPVKEIGEGALSRLVNMTSLTIFENISYIAPSSLTSCYSLIDINVADGNNAYKAIDNILYSKDGKTLICYPHGKAEKTFNIPSSVSVIGDYSFINSINLTSVSMDNRPRIPNLHPLKNNGVF